MRLDSYSLSSLVSSLSLEGKKIIAISINNKPHQITFFLDDNNAFQAILQPPITCLLYLTHFMPPKRSASIPALWSNLSGALISSVELISGSRIVRLQLTHENSYSIFLEFFGKSPKVALQNQAQTLAIFPTPSSNLNYSLPVSQPLSPLPPYPPDDWLTFPSEESSSQLARRFLPGSPLLFEQAWQRMNSSLMSKRIVSWKIFVSIVAEMMAECGAFAALATNPKQHSVFAPYSLLVGEGWRIEEFDALADAAYAAWQQDWQLYNQRQLLDNELHKLKAEAARISESIKQSEIRISEYENEEVWRKEAEALLIWGETSRGRNQVTLPDHYGGKDLVIELGPAHTPQEEAELRFAKAHKAARGRKITAERIIKLHLRFQAIQTQISGLSKGNISPSNIETTGLKSPKVKKAPPITQTKRSSARVFISSDGFEILVGKTAVENEEVTFKLGRSNDLWLHARSREGAHVIVKLGKDGNIPPHTLAEAAGLAAYFSKGRQEKAVEVIYTRRKFVTRRRNMPRGAVLVSQEKVFYAKPALPPNARDEMN